MKTYITNSFIHWLNIINDWFEHHRLGWWILPNDIKNLSTILKIFNLGFRGHMELKLHAIFFYVHMCMLFLERVHNFHQTIKRVHDAEKFKNHMQHCWVLFLAYKEWRNNLIPSFLIHFNFFFFFLLIEDKRSKGLRYFFNVYC